MNRLFALSLAAALLPLSATAAAEGAPQESRALGVETGISFPSNATIRTFQADGEDGVWIQDSRRDWYYATFFGPCRSAPPPTKEERKAAREAEKAAKAAADAAKSN